MGMECDKCVGDSWRAGKMSLAAGENVLTTNNLSALSRSLGQSTTQYPRLPAGCCRLSAMLLACWQREANLSPFLKTSQPASQRCLFLFLFRFRVHLCGHQIARCCLSSSVPPLYVIQYQVLRSSPTIVLALMPSNWRRGPFVCCCQLAIHQRSSDANSKHCGWS